MTATTLLTLIRPPSATVPGLCAIENERKSAVYEFVLFPVARDMGAMGIELRRMGADEPYHLLLAEDGTAVCDCRGYVAESHCKHSDVAAELVCGSVGELVR